MIKSFARALLGKSSALPKDYRRKVAAIEKLLPSINQLSSSQLLEAANKLRERASNGEKPDALLPEAFSLASAAATKHLGLTPFKVQLLGGCVLYDGKIAEMKTGEGKTLTAILPACLHALCNRTVHIITVNDYLAKRDAEWMRPAYQALGIDASINLNATSPEQKKQTYNCPVVYGTNNEFGFDSLRDNLRYVADSKVQRNLDFAIVDEVDSILIDEARTPLTISSTSGDLTSLYLACNELTKNFKFGKQISETETEGDFYIDEKSRSVHFTDEGYDLAERLFAKHNLLHDGGLYEAHNLQLMHHLIAALRANYSYQRDRDYLVQDGRIVIIDEHTGRPLAGRRWGEGLHQSIEAKEQVKIEPESQAVASTTLQNYFRNYDKLAGMTGTASTEAEEFAQIYNLAVLPIPTHMPMIREDGNDRIYRTADGKLRNLIKDIENCYKRSQPVLIGTTSVSSSEQISNELTRKKIQHNVLNAKHHAREAEIIAQAGMPKAVTIAANMAGRGTDIVLGGNIERAYEEINIDESLDEQAKQNACSQLQIKQKQLQEETIKVGGLRIIGTERHESRRIDNQLRGRSGRQGDPGSSQFYLSFEDSLLRIFAAERISKIMVALKIDDDEALEAGMVTRVIENAQRKVEAHNFDIRKQLLEYDDIVNDQRKIIYDHREQILTAENIAQVADELVVSAIQEICNTYLHPNKPEETWLPDVAQEELQKFIPEQIPIKQWLDSDTALSAKGVIERIIDLTRKLIAQRAEKIGSEQITQITRTVVLNIIDSNWRNHLMALDHLRQSVGLRGFAQKNPKQEYRREALELFNQMLINIRLDTAKLLTSIRLKEAEAPPPNLDPIPAQDGDITTSNNQSANLNQNASPKPANKLMRNDPCYCGSGKKYKNCHGKLR